MVGLATALECVLADKRRGGRQAVQFFVAVQVKQLQLAQAGEKTCVDLCQVVVVNVQRLERRRQGAFDFRDRVVAQAQQRQPRQI